MNVYDIDFTSRPRRGKPITCLACRQEGDRLCAVALSSWSGVEPFEAFLRHASPWIAGIDFPFGQSRTFVSNIGWPMTWSGSVRLDESFDRAGFRLALDAYRQQRPGRARTPINQ
ncbi:hypothetical protein [uncultured Thiocystis sp.]|jgi:hypothetical protein|uniref:hypothetical protein n=1 Tax=uncultured Thiocystis sp. TaxID=1202134 RepID=UPI0025EEFCDA|nr:hypothetical protein [uncultured Thiocystis sp.]